MHLARKAFWPALPPFPFLHIATTWDFQDMIVYRDLLVAALGIKLIAHTNQDGIRRGINPIASGPTVHAQVMSTEGLKQALDNRRYRRGVRRRAPRRGDEPRQGAHLLVPHAAAHLGPAQPAPGAVERLQRPRRQGRIDPRVPAVELDRGRHLVVHPRRGDPGRSAVFREGAPGRAPHRRADPGRRRSLEAGARREAGEPA